MSEQKRDFDKEAASWDLELGSRQKFDSSEKNADRKNNKASVLFLDMIKTFWRKGNKHNAKIRKSK